MKLVFGVHVHQPVGNFGWVIEQIYDQSYRPFLDVAERHPGIRFCLHVTGPLFEWIDAQRPAWLDRVRALVAAGRVEILGGGFYEPILVAVPEADRLGQIMLMRERMRERLGVAPRGVWLAERVWEPHLAGSLSHAGVEYALLDDYHFVQAGVAPEHLEHGALLTDDLGAEVALLPISEKLRYLIPFQDPERTVAYCREVHERDPEGVLVMVDDGEKFGAWPGTAELVYDRGWLDRFFTALEQQSDWLEMAHPGEVLDARPPRERVYLPPGSYFEMSEWSLPMPAAEIFQNAVARYRDQNLWAEMRPFFRGGFWRQFFQKYEESLLMQRRSLLLHDDLRRAVETGADSVRIEEARDNLWRAQCNCAYWHGVFGGLMLPHLRHAVWRHLILGTQILQSTAPAPPLSRVTLIGREGTDLRLSGEAWELFLSADRGGALVSWEDRRGDWNLQNTLQRRREAYHTKIEAAASRTPADGDQQGASIHDILWEVKPEVRDALAVDSQPRFSLLERLLHPDATHAQVLSAMAAADGADLAAAPATIDDGSLSADQASASFVLTGRYRDPAGCEIPVSLQKTISLDPRNAALSVRWVLSNMGDRELTCHFASEWNLAFYDGGVFLDGAEDPLGAAALPARDEFAVRVPLHEARLRWRLQKPAVVWIHPVRTATQGEDGYHLTYQGHLLLFHWPVSLPAGDEIRFELNVDLAHGAGADA